MKLLPLAAAVAALALAGSAHAVTLGTGFETIGTNLFPMNTTYSDGGLDVAYIGHSFSESSLDQVYTIDNCIDTHCWEAANGGTGYTRVVRHDGGTIASLTGYFDTVNGPGFLDFAHATFWNNGVQVGFEESGSSILKSHSSVAPWTSQSFTCFGVCDEVRLWDPVPEFPGADGLGIDNLTVVGGATSVPEPASWALLLAGFGGLGAMLRRRRFTLASA